MAHTGLKLLNETGANFLILVPGAGLEPARILPDPRDFKSRVSTNSTIRALHRSYEGKTEIEANWTLNREGLSYKRPSRKEIKLNEQWRQYQCDRAQEFD
jgi:hypothetical protein